MMMAIAIIPARGGSQRIPKKNIKMFHGKPIIAYSIEAAFLSGLFQDVIVSTDDDDIASIAREYGAEIHIRNPLYAVNSVGTQEVAKHVLIDNGYRWGMACVIYATAPMIDQESLTKGFGMMMLAKDLDTLFCYSTDHRGDDAGQFYWGRIPAFRDGELLFDGKFVPDWTGKILVPDDTVCDINTHEDWARAEGMYLKLQRVVA